MSEYRVIENRSSIDIREGETYQYDHVIKHLIREDCWFTYILIPKNGDEAASDNEFISGILEYISRIGKIRELVDHLKKRYEYIEMENQDEKLLIFLFKLF